MSISTPAHVGNSPVSQEDADSIVCTSVSLSAGDMLHVWLNGHTSGIAHGLNPTISATGLSFTELSNVSRFGDYQAWWYVVAGSSFSGDITCSQDHGNGNNRSMRMIAIKITGQHATTPIAEHVGPTGVDSNNPSISLVDCASDSLVLAMCCNNQGSGAYTSHTLTEINNNDLTNGANPHMEIQYSYNVTTAGWGCTGSTGTHQPEIVEIAAAASGSVTADSTIACTTTVAATAIGKKIDDATIACTTTFNASAFPVGICNISVVAVVSGTAYMKRFSSNNVITSTTYVLASLGGNQTGFSCGAIRISPTSDGIWI